MYKKKLSVFALLAGIIICCADCSKTSSDTGGTVTPTPATPVNPGTTSGTNDMDLWVTKPDQSALLQQQSGMLSFGTLTNSNVFIDVDSSTSFQSIDGFGYTLTGSSAYVINHMGTAEKAALLTELFGNSTGNIGVSYLRISIGASDLSPSVYTYDDLPAGSTDPTLASFSIAQENTDLIPVLHAILAINPNIKILASPWSAPSWMKDNGATSGGTLLAADYAVYANYFVKYLQAMTAQGIHVDAITLQNEPQNPSNNPSMVLSAAQEATFVKANLGPAFQTAGLTTKIIVWDHNCDNAAYPMAVLADAAAYPYIDGSAFHLYAGDISALDGVHTAYPAKNLYFTEQYTATTGSFSGDFNWHIKNVIIGSMKYWSKNALEWNLANDASFGPYTPGGCNTCKGALTISGSAVTRNVGYYIIAQASKFIPAGSTRIASTYPSNLINVAFKRADGKKVMIVLNDNATPVSFNIRYKGRWVPASLTAGAAGTFIWQ